ncbi:MAG TPA: AI-2E family transporter [Planctomycetia bacterium]|nr:AI-2E family transporter [Planctomycetia bacterium]
MPKAPASHEDLPEIPVSLQHQDRVMLRLFLFAGLAVLGTTVLSLASAVVIPVALALLFRATLAPLVDKVQTWGARKIWAVTIVMLGFAAVAGLLGYAMSADVRSLGAQFGKYREGLRRNLDAWIGAGSPVHRLLKIDGPPPAPGSAAAAEAEKAAEPPTASNEVERADRARRTATAAAAAAPAAQWLADLAAALAGAAFRFLGGVSLTLALTYALLLHGDDMRDRLLRLAGYGQITRSTRLLEDAGKLVGAYLFWHAIANLSFGVSFALLLWVFSIPYATTWGILAAVARFIPYVGTWFGIAPALLLAAAIMPTAGGLALLVACAVMLGLIFNSVIDRALVSRATGLSAVTIVVSAGFWTWLWGPLGLVLATPITVCITVLGRHLEFLRPFASLLELESNVEPSFRFYQRLAARRYVDAAELAEKRFEELGGAAFGDEVLAPALARLEADVAAGVVDPEAAREALSEVTEILLDLEPPVRSAPEPAGLLAGARPTDGLVASWLARLAPRNLPLAVAGPELMVSELAAWIIASEARLIVLVALDESALARTRHVLKLLKRDGSRIRIVVFLAGSLADRPELDIPIREWGASETVSTGAEALAKLRESATLSVPV